MVLPAQFQLGLELTNIVNPISQALSALGSLALMDAIKKSGSDLITETKLASLIGRHRIDPVIKFHFREMVAESGQSLISRYLDIVLESGSGPTVQEALKNPALFSMVIQLSGLAFAHEDESLANAMVEAIENIAQESASDVSIVPDYVSLLGTIRACQQQTAAFRWALLYEAAEEKIQKIVRDQAVDAYQKNDKCRPRSLPIPVLQGLFMWLQSLQSFPEHRVLHLRCHTGVSTVVVWCHHILGLSLVINTEGTEVRFGDAPYNLVVEKSRSQKAAVSLMDPLDPQEPLFTLQNDEHSIGTSYEQRAEAYGYGTKLLQFAGFHKREWRERAQCVVSRSVETYGLLGMSCGFSEPHYPSENRILSAGRFLFALGENPTVSSPKSASRREWCQDATMLILVSIVITFARISDDDLARCSQMPLALNVSSIPIPIPIPEIRGIPDDPTNLKGSLNLLESFKVLCFLILGRHMSHDDYVKPAVLVSAWGWSVFLDSIDSVDPFDVSVDKLRVVRGVPSRRGLRRTRIIDGPQSHSLLAELGTSERYGYLERIRIYRAPGVSTAEKGVTLVGHHSDAFEVTQNFTCHQMRTSTYRYGFREMADWCIWSRRLPPCQCNKLERGFPTLTSEHIDPARKVSLIDNLIEGDNELLRRATRHEASWRVFASRDGKRCFVYDSDNPAARWIQLEFMYSHCEGIKEVDRDYKYYYIGLGGSNTCVKCAVRNSEHLPVNGIFLL